MASHYFTWGQQFSIPTKSTYAKLQKGTGCFPRSYEDIKAEWDQTMADIAASRDIAQPFTYNPQGLSSCSIIHEARVLDSIVNHTFTDDYEQTMTGYPRQLLSFNTPPSTERVHPTQKPTELVEYLIRTYSNPGEVVVDACMGSGTTAVAAIRAGRNFIGFELDEQYHAIATSRVADEIDRLLESEAI